MPPKVQVEEPVLFVFERDRMLKKFFYDNYTTRQKIMEKSVKVPVKSPQDPTKKLKERLETYCNVRKMRTDYKNYVRWYGQPPFDVPTELKV